MKRRRTQIITNELLMIGPPPVRMFSTAYRSRHLDPSATIVAAGDFNFIDFLSELCV